MLWAALCITANSGCECPLCAKSRHMQCSKNALLDQLIGARPQRGGQVETERLRCFYVDHQLVFGRLLNRKVGWLLALENAIDVRGRAAVLVDLIRSVRD